MAFVKLYKVVQDGAWGYQSANQLADNAADLRTQMFVEHGSFELLLTRGLAGSVAAPRYDDLGHHNLREIPRTVAQTVVLQQFSGILSSGLAWSGPGLSGCYWISTGVYFLPVVGLSSFWGKAVSLVASSVTPLEPQVRALFPPATNGLGPGLQVSLFKLAFGDFVPDDQPFTIALYGSP